MQRCRTFFCASLLHAALSYSLRFAASCSVVVLSALRCFMQRCRTLCASLPMQRCRTLCASLLHAALYSLRFAASCSVVVLSIFIFRLDSFLLTNGCFAYCHVYCIIVLITSCISQYLYILMQFFSYMT